MMNLLEMKNKFLTIVKDKKKVDTVYSQITNEISIDLTKTLKTTVKNTSKGVSIDLEFTDKQAKKIIKRPVGGKNVFQRLLTRKNKLKKDIKTIKDENTLKNRVIREFNRTKRIINNETHRIIETGKDVVYKVAPEKLRKKWVAMLKNTRDAHLKLHNTYDKNGIFEVDGYTTQYPSGFGVGYLDINCRCKLILERVKA